MKGKKMQYPDKMMTLITKKYEESTSPTEQKQLSELFWAVNEECLTSQK